MPMDPLATCTAKAVVGEAIMTTEQPPMSLVQRTSSALLSVACCGGPFISNLTAPALGTRPERLTMSPARFAIARLLLTGGGGPVFIGVCLVHTRGALRPLEDKAFVTP